METHDSDNVLLTPKENKLLRDRARYDRLKLKFTPDQLKSRQEKQREYYEKRKLSLTDEDKENVKNKKQRLELGRDSDAYFFKI